MPDLSSPLKVFMIAGEASGDRLGADMMRVLRERAGKAVVFCGIGGEEMEEQGLSSLFPMRELSIMGIAEILPRLPQIMRRISQTVDAIEKTAPDVLVTIDSPDFTLRVAKAVHRRVMNRRMNRVILVHYVAPTVWAWRPGRARAMARFLDGILCLLPFEPPFFEREGLRAVFAGHPVVNGPFTRGDGQSFRAQNGIDPRRKLLCLLPGSRLSELEKTGRVLAQSARRIAREMPGIGIIVPTLPHLREAVERLTDEIRDSVFIVTGDARADAFAACDAALATSGTVGLELAAAGVPHLIAYRMNALSWSLARRMVRVRYAHLVNILLDSPAVPEFLQQDCTPEKIVPAALNLLRGEDSARTQKAGFAEAMALLGKGLSPPPAARAADFVLSFVQKT